MDYEKLHKDTIAKLQEMVNSGKITVETARGICADFVPESEDERIRKALIDYFSEQDGILTAIGCSVRTKDILAWLEKQGKWNTDNSIWHKVKPNEYVLEKTLICKKNGEIDLVEDTILSVTGAKYALPVSSLGIPKPLEKQGEQKQDANIQINPSEYINDMGGNGCYLKNTAQTSAWSEENEENFKHLMDEIVCLGNSRNSANRLYYDRLIKFIEELKNRAQPKEKWCNKDERMLDRLIAYFEKQVAFTDDDNPRYANWLKSLKERVQPQPKQEWKQENTGDLTDFENAMMHIGGSFFGQHAGLDPNDTNAIKEQANLLLELVPKQEWSEDDIATISRVISIVKWVAYSDHSHPILNDEGATELVERLKSLKERYTWRPSEEQMDALHYVTNFDYGGHKATLVSLYEQLKKLK